MMNWIVSWGVKKYVLGIVNTAIEKYNGNIAVARGYVNSYIAKIEAVLAFLKGLDAKIADGKLTEAEADQLVDEAGKLATELTK